MTAPVAVLAVLATVAAVALLVPGRSRLPALPSGAGPAARRLVPVVAAPVLVAVVGARPSWVVLAVVLAAATAGGAALWRARRARRAADATSLRVLECCEQLAGELAAGQPPGAALARVAEEWAPLAPVAEAFRVGADVPEAWRACGTLPGAGDLRFVGAAWQVAHRTGRGLAGTLDQAAHELRAAHATRRVVEGELASARATARLVAGLPVVALLMGSGAGGDPLGFLAGHPVGLACLAAGLALALTGLAWIEALAREVQRR